MLYRRFYGVDCNLCARRDDNTVYNCSIDSHHRAVLIGFISDFYICLCLPVGRRFVHGGGNVRSLSIRRPRTYSVQAEKLPHRDEQRRNNYEPEYYNASEP